MSEWQPIETAKPNESVIVFADGNVGEAIWKRFVWSEGDVDDEGWWWANTDGEYSYQIRPTHWMPLPAPPKD